MPRSCSANTVPCAITSRLRSLASRVMTSCTSPSADSPPPCEASPPRSTNGITATAARRATPAAASAAFVSTTAGGACVSIFTRGSAPARACRHAARSFAPSRPSEANSRSAAARCSSPSCSRPRCARASSSRSCTRRSSGASCRHASSRASNSSGLASAASRCSSATWRSRKRWRWPISQPLNSGLRSSSMPSRKSPPNSCGSVRRVSASIASMPPCVARSISTASTKQSDRSSATVSPSLATRRRPGSSSSARALLRHQRSSPRGSLGTSHSISHRCPRVTGCAASAR